jgi:hypothetical protein
MAKRLKYSRQSARKPGYILMSGDRVVAENTQYAAKVGGGRFQKTEDGHKEFKVVGIHAGLVEVQAVRTGIRSFRHENQLKLMTKRLPAEASSSTDQDMPPDVKAFLDRIQGGTSNVDTGRKEIALSDGLWTVFPVLDDGQCFYRCADIHQRGVLVDSDLHSYELRIALANFFEDSFLESKGTDHRAMRRNIPYELLDDPAWKQRAQGAVDGDCDFDFHSYFLYQRRPSTFASSSNLKAFSKMTGVGVEVYQYDKKKDKHFLAWSQAGTKKGTEPLRMLRGGLHYEYLYRSDPAQNSL